MLMFSADGPMLLRSPSEFRDFDRRGESLARLSSDEACSSRRSPNNDFRSSLEDVTFGSDAEAPLPLCSRPLDVRGGDEDGLEQKKFLDASTHLFKRDCHSVRPSVRRSVSRCFKSRKMTNLTNLRSLTNLQI